VNYQYGYKYLCQKNTFSMLNELFKKIIDYWISSSAFFSISRMQLSGRYYFFSGLPGTTAIFRPEGNIPFFSTAPTTMFFSEPSCPLDASL